MSNHIKDVMYDKEPNWNSIEFKLKTRANPDEAMIDSVLTEKGKMQCAIQKEKEKVRLSKVKHLLVSPFSRCLETTDGLFDTKDFLEKGGKITVRQELREMLCCQSDLPTSIFENVSRFPDFDFSVLQNDLKKYGELFFLASIGDEELKQRIEAFALEAREEKTKKEKEAFLLGLLKESIYAGEYLESIKATYQRICKFKKKLFEKMESEEIKDGELAIVAHYGIIQAWTATGYDKDKGKYVGQINPKNCQIVDYDLM